MVSYSKYANQSKKFFKLTRQMFRQTDFLDEGKGELIDQEDFVSLILIFQ